MRHKLISNKVGVFIGFALAVVLNAQLVQAQNAPDFVQSVENKIQQESQAGLINQKQAYQLQKKQAKIHQKIAKDLRKHGGRLSSEEMHKLAKEAKALNRSVNDMVHKNNRDVVATPIYQAPEQGGVSTPPAGNLNWNGDNQNFQPVLRDRH